MTLKEAYEVFFGHTDERVTGKYIFDELSEAEIKKVHRELLMKWHPDLNPNNQNEAHLMTIRINEAYNLLNKTYLEEKRKEERAKEEKAKADKAKKNKISPEEREKLVKKYSQLYRKAANVYKYKLFMKYQEDIDKYYELTRFDEKRQQSLVDTYRYIELYKKCKGMFQEQIDMLNKRYKTAKKYLNSSELSEDKLYEMYLEIVGPYQSIINDHVKYAEIMDWFSNKMDIVLEEDMRKESIILNIDNKIVQRVSQIRKNFEIIANFKKYNMMEETYQKLNSKNSELDREEVLRVCGNYKKFVEFLDLRKIELHRECMKYIELARNGEVIIDSEFLSKLEDKLNNILVGSPEELKALFNDEMQIEKFIKKIGFDSKNRKINAIYNQNRMSYIISINESIEYLHKLKKMAAREERKLGFEIPSDKASKNLTDEELVLKLKEVCDMKEQACYVVIDSIYSYLVCYYANNTEEKEIPGDILDIIRKVKCSSPENRQFDLNECLYYLDGIYQEKITEYNVRPREKIQEAARLALTNKINLLKSEMDGYMIPAGIENDFLKVEYFDVVALYEFIERIEDYLYSQKYSKRGK